MLGNYIFNRINLYINKGNLFYINIDEPINNGYLTKNQILKQIKLKEKKLNEFINTYVKSDSQMLPSEKIIKTISNYTLK